MKIYNLAEDLGEAHDLSNTTPEQARALFQAYKDFLDSRVLTEDALGKLEKATNRTKSKSKAKAGEGRKGKRTVVAPTAAHPGSR